MNTSFIALGVAIVAVAGLIFHAYILNLVIVVIETYFGKPKFKVLRSSIDGNGFAFAFDFNDAKEPAKFNRFKLRLFNPWGSPTQAEVSKDFSPESKSFAKDLDMGKGLIELLGASNFEQAKIMVELSSDKDGVNHQFEMDGSKFKKQIQQASQTVDQYLNVSTSKPSAPPIGTVTRSFIADVVPGKGDQLAIPTNPAFAHLFSGGGEADAGGGAAAEQFAVTKVWIEPGCIVCNACEDIYPEVFEVTADTCLIRPDAPLDDGIKINDAAEACPVEVIKFTKAS